MKKHLCALLAATVIFGMSQGASAATIDLNSLTLGSYSETEFNSFFTDVSFDNIVGDHFSAQTGPNSTVSILNGNSSVAGNKTRATFTDFMNYVSVDIGDFNSDADTLFLYAYDSANNLLDFASFDNPASSRDMHTLEVNSLNLNIAYVEFYGVGINDANNVYWDNFSYSNEVPVPEPTSAVLGLSTLAGLLGIKRKQKTA